MTLDNLIEGLTILRKYFKADGYHIGAEHDQFYVYETSKRVAPADVVKLRRLGWSQESSEEDDEDASDAALIKEYKRGEGWTCFT